MAELPTVRYINALFEMSKSPIADFRIFAKQCIRDISEPKADIEDYLKPFMTLPHKELDYLEQQLRKFAEQFLSQGPHHGH